MGLTRAELNTAITAELAGVLTLAGFAATDASGAMKEPLDRTLRALGLPETGLAAATVDDGAEAKAIAFARYFVLDKAVYATVAKIDVSAGSAKAALSQQHEHLKQQRDEARVTAETYGLWLLGSGVGSIAFFTAVGPRY